MKNLTEALTFDDVLIVPSKSSVKPTDADVTTKITKKYKPKDSISVGSNGHCN